MDLIDIAVGGLVGFALTVTFYTIKQRIGIRRVERWADKMKTTLDWHRDVPQ